LYGNYDGGGTLAVGMSWNNVVSHAGRNGGVEFWEYDTTDDGGDDVASDGENNDGGDEAKKFKDLKYLGSLLDDVLVTSLHWTTEDDLWIGTQDGRVLLYNIDIDEEEEEIEPDRLAEWKNMGGSVLSVNCNEELDVAVVTTSKGLVKLLSVEKPKDEKSFRPPFESNNSFALCATIVKEEEDTNKFSIVCGGNDGSLFRQPLTMVVSEEEDNTVSAAMDAEIDLDNPFEDSDITLLMPKHDGRCKCLISPFPGIVLSGGQDGTIRLWDLEGGENEELQYLLGGFKAWLGSFWTDGERLISDGADNNISILEF